MLAIVLGCSTTNKSSAPIAAEFDAPAVANWPINSQLTGDKDFGSVDLFLSRVAKENPTTNTIWWADYRRAQLWMKKDRNVSCENFSRLAQDMRFPLRRIAFLHAHEVCPKDNQILARLETFQLEQFDPWLNDIATDVAIEKAALAKNDAKLLELYQHKSKLSPRREDKIQFADAALKAANRLGDKAKAKEIRARIYGISPSRDPKPDKSDLIAVANDYRYLRDFENARHIYNNILRQKSASVTEKLAAYRGLRTNYKIQQKREESLNISVKMAQYNEGIYKKSKKTASDAHQYVDTMMQLARNYWTENQNDKALKTLDKIESQVKGRTSLVDVQWMRGRMAEERQDFKEAILWFQAALKETIDTPGMKDRISWYLAWNERKAGQYDEAIAILKDLQKRADGAFDKDRYQFWLAKTYQAKHDSDAKDEFKSLIKNDPLNYYGLLAHRELGLPLPAKTISKADEDAEERADTKTITKRLRNWMDPIYFNWLVAVHENNIARDYLDNIAKSLKKSSPRDSDSWVALLHSYARSQNYQAMFNQLSALDADVRRGIVEENPQIVFPAPYFETVAQSAGRFGISVEFIYSIMRQESSFNPQARSQMDAFGLMQLLPEVAKRSAIANNIEYSSTDELYEPHVNIPIGASYLRELWDKYNGEIILAVASYNARDEAIVSWLKTRYRGDTLEFIEDIPYDETRDYVKLVLRNMITYEIMTRRDENMLFPEWALKISYEPSK